MSYNNNTSPAPADGFTFADNPYSSPLRQWIYQFLLKEFPIDEKEYRSDDPVDGKTPRVFYNWTGLDKDGLLEKQRTDPTFSTCSTFISRYITKIRLAAGLANPSNGQPIKGQHTFQSFDLSKNGKAWHPKSHLAVPSVDKPSVGDLFGIGVPGNVKHVGVILNSNTAVWQTIEAGQGQIGKYDSIKRRGWHTPPVNELYGWINIDEYFDTWNLVKK